MLKSIILASSIMLSFPSFSANWEKLDSSDVANVYIDKSSIEYEKKGRASLWVKYKYIVPTKHDFLPTYTISGFVRKDQINCKNNEYTYETITWYDVNGQAVLVEKGSGKPTTINPGTLGDSELQYVCTQSKKVIPVGPSF